jgi:peptidylprolyl isomerase
MRMSPFLLPWVAAAVLAAGCQPRSDTPPAAGSAPSVAEPGAPAFAAADTAVWPVEGAGRRTASGLRYWDLEPGTGPVARDGMTVSVHYVGRLEDGTVFDHSYGRGAPLIFPLGQGRVIRGWEEGLRGMQVGGRRRLVIPPDLAYGDSGAGGVIPPGATLVFQVVLTDAR